ncbi:hypothetical protein WMF30_53015 [Sorangium sp. So ce134]
MRARRSARAAVAAAVAACAGACADQGEILLVVQTDLAVPKDVDAITVEVETDGALLFSSSFPQGQGELELPGTLGVVSRDPDKLVTARAIAWRGGTPRIVREAVTRAPEGRVAMLRLPLHWLCDGLAGPAEAPAAGACRGATAGDPASAETCVLGACAPATVDPGALPDYAAADVFGGGSGSGVDGRCFDVTACFEGAAPAEVRVDELAGCSAPGDRHANVAVQTRTDGVCGPRGCLVVLDAPDDAGFPAAQGRVRLPDEICDRLVEGEALGVVTSTPSARCPLKTERVPVCGPWSLAAGWTPDPAAPVTLAAGQHQPTAIALADDHVYWTTAGPNGDGEVKRIARDGGALEVLASQQALPSGLTLHDANDGTGTWAYWTNDGTEAVMRAPAAPGGPAPAVLTVFRGTRSGVAVLDDDVYWSTSTGLVLELPVAGGRVVQIASEQPEPVGLVAAGETLFWINRGEGAVMKRDGSTSVALARGEGRPGTLAADGTHVYWTRSGARGAVVRIAREGGGEVEEIAAGLPFPYAIAVDATRVYWTNLGDGTVMTAPRAGGQPKVVAAGQPNPVAISVDGRNVVWANAGTAARAYADGAILRLAR